MEIADSFSGILVLMGNEKPMVSPVNRLVGDPIPFRFGKFEPGMFTKREMVKIGEILSDAKGKKMVHRSPGNDEDLWTAFVSLLRGGYIKETHSMSLVYVLTDKGASYARSLDV